MHWPKKDGEKRQRKNKLKPKKFGWSSKNSKISSVFGFRFWGRKNMRIAKEVKKNVNRFHSVMHVDGQWLKSGLVDSITGIAFLLLLLKGVVGSKIKRLID